MTWKENIAADLAESKIEVRAWTYPRALSLIEDAAWNRRMKPEDYIGRAALAFAVHDSAGEVSWEAVTRLEPEIDDLRRRNLRRKRHFGHDFGQWEIGGLR